MKLPGSSLEKSMKWKKNIYAERFINPSFRRQYDIIAALIEHRNRNHPKIYVSNNSRFAELASICIHKCSIFPKHLASENVEVFLQEKDMCQDSVGNMGEQ